MDKVRVATALTPAEGRGPVVVVVEDGTKLTSTLVPIFVAVVDVGMLVPAVAVVVVVVVVGVLVPASDVVPPGTVGCGVPTPVPGALVELVPDPVVLVGAGPGDVPVGPIDGLPAIVPGGGVEVGCAVGDPAPVVGVPAGLPVVGVGAGCVGVFVGGGGVGDGDDGVYQHRNR